jgi:superfamily I DNA and RNA helicase
MVDLEGTYPDSEVEKDMILYRCYRTPRPVLIAAHIFGMGLLRPKGAVQFVPTQGGWEDIGYEIVSGSFQPGQKLTIKRPEANSPHLLEKLEGYKNLIKWEVFQDTSHELAWVAQQISENIHKDELKPEEIVVISLDWKRMDNDFSQLQMLLLNMGIFAARPGRDIDKEKFWREKHVTLSGIFPAKGNEASIVYVIGFEEVGTNPRLIVQERNQAFTAMTRTRGWCILTGIGERARALFKEIEEILRDPEQITFTVPDPKTIQRNLDNLEYEKRRNRIKKAKELTDQLARILEEIDDTGDKKKLVAELKKKLMEKL